MSSALRLFGTLFLLFAVAQCAPTGEQKKPLEAHRDDVISLVNKVNGHKSSWKAQAHPRFVRLSAETKKHMLGLKAFRDGSLEKHKQELAALKKSTGGVNKGASKSNAGALPEEFDSRKHFPECEALIDTIQDQGQCGSCWAVASASVMQDRTCIGSKGERQVSLSAQDILSCLPEPNEGCKGGYPEDAFFLWGDEGVVTGSNNSANQGCKPYYPFLAHSGVAYQTPECIVDCENLQYPKMYEQDKHFGHSVHSMHFSGQEEIMQEIMANGPVEANMLIYEDFFFYGEGVYINIFGKLVGGHAVRIIGWGVEDLGGLIELPYWLVANSWGADWGEQGYFRILRDNDECLIESWSINFGLAKL